MQPPFFSLGVRELESPTARMDLGKLRHREGTVAQPRALHHVVGFKYLEIIMKLSPSTGRMGRGVGLGMDLCKLKQLASSTCFRLCGARGRGCWVAAGPSVSSP